MVKELYDSIQRTKQAKLDLAVATERGAAAELAARTTKASVTAAGDATRGAIDRVQDRSEAIRQARAKVYKAEQDAAELAAGLEARRQASLLQKEQQTQAAVLAAQQQFAERKAAIQATGTQTGLKAARAERDATIATLEQAHERSIAATNRYWDRRVLMAREGAQATINAERLVFMQSLSAFDGSMNLLNKQKDRLGRTTGADTAAQEKLAEANAAKAAAAENAKLAGVLAAQSGTMGVLKVLWADFSLAVRTGGTMLSAFAGIAMRVGSALLSAFGWITLIYQLADMLGIVNAITPAVQKFTDAIGLTSEASRKARVEREADNALLLQQKKILEDTAASYRALRDAKEGNQVATKANQLAETASTGGTTEIRKTAVADLVAVLDGAAVTMEAKADAAYVNAKAKIDALDTQTQDALARFNAAKAAMGKESAGAKTMDEAAAIRAKWAPQIAGLAQAYGVLTTSLGAAQRDLGALSGSVQQATKDYQAAAEATATMFTPESLAVANEFGARLRDNNTELDKATKLYQEIVSRRDPNDAAQTKVLDDLEAKIRTIRIANDGLMTSLRDRINELKATMKPGSDATNALTSILEFVKLDPAKFNTLLTAANKASKESLTGKNGKGGVVPPASGQDAFAPNGKAQESLANRLAKARYERAKAENEAIANLVEEGFKLDEQINEEHYRKGLKSISDYYGERKRIQLAGLDTEISQRYKDIEEAKREQSLATDEVSKLRFGTDIVRLTGQIDVLNARRKSIDQTTNAAIERDTKAFRDSVLAENAKLLEDGFIPGGAVKAAESKLDSLKESAREKLASLRANAQAGIANALEDSMRLDAARTGIGVLATDLGNELSKIDNIRAELQQNQTAGLTTTAEAAAKYTTTVNDSIAKLRGFVDAQQAILDQNADLAGTAPYQALALQIEQARLKLRGLQQETNQIAVSLNNGLRDSIASTLANMEFSIKGVGDAILGLLKSVAQQVQSVIAKDIAENMVRAIGSVGSGGFGGFVESLLGGGASKNDGTTPDRPLYVQDAGITPAPGIEELLKTGQDTTKGIFSVLPDKIGGFFGSFGTMFSGALSALTTFLGSSFAALISAIFTSSSADSASGGLSSLLNLGSTAMAHTGGVIGRSILQRRHVPLGMFYGATKYHTGGIVGLQPNEVPIIAKKGEEVLTKGDPRHRDNATKNEAGSSGGTVNVWVVTPDQQPTMGPNDVVAIVGDNIARGGSIKKLVRQVAIGG